jgi:hypothetical protein
MIHFRIFGVLVGLIFLNPSLPAAEWTNPKLRAQQAEIGSSVLLQPLEQFFKGSDAKATLDGGVARRAVPRKPISLNLQLVDVDEALLTQIRSSCWPLLAWPGLFPSRVENRILGALAR